MAWALTLAAGVGARAETANEFWPEAQLHVGLDDKTKLIVQGGFTRSRETRSGTEGQLGIALDYRFDDLFSARAGYRYVTSLGEASSRIEHRLLLEQTFHIPLPWDIRLGLRTREDLRWINGKFSARIRERALFERDVKIEDYTFTPYASAEIYYDTRFDRFTRNRFVVGAVFPIYKPLSIDVYFARQNDSRSEPKHVNAFGLVFILTFP